MLACSRGPRDTPRIKRRRILSVFIPMDELFIDARAPLWTCGQNVGHMPCRKRGVRVLQCVLFFCAFCVQLSTYILTFFSSCLFADGRFDGFHVYICASLLLRYASTLKLMGFQEIVQFLQKLPTKDWGISEVEELLGQAYIYKASFDSSPSHISR